MKKFVSILLALALILSLSTTAFATAVTIADDDAVTRTYNGYQLLTLTTSLKSNCGCAEDATTHKDDCYNYAYTVNETYEEILQTLATAAGKTDILEYLSGLKSDDEGATLRPVADEIYRAIQEGGIEADKTELKGNGDTIDQGYWLFADVTDLTNKEEANSLVIVDTKGQDSLTITPKTGLPTLVKKVKDTNDTDGTTTDWQDSADHDITDTVDFQLTATMPENIASYDTYKIVFHDTLSEGLDLNANSVKVYMFANKDAAEADNDLTDNTPVSGFTTATSGLTDNCTFEVRCDDVTEITGVTKDAVFVVYYEATLNEKADIGLPGNPNTAYLEFSNNPYGTGTGATTPDKVIVFTYQLTINKTDADAKPLAGAGFTLYKQDADGNYNAIVVDTDAEGKPVTELKGDTMTIFNWAGLDDGNYKLVETTVPAGYNKMADKEFTISAEHDTESDAPGLTELDSTLGTAQKENGALTGVITDDIVNQTGTVLPETGARGTVMLITISTMFVMVATVFMVTRKKMSIYKD